MTEYLDSKRKELRKGFYGHFETNQVFYFTGSYNKKGFPIFDNENHNLERYIPQVYANFTKNLYTLTKKSVKEKINKLKEKTNWLEERLKK